MAVFCDIGVDLLEILNQCWDEIWCDQQNLCVHLHFLNLFEWFRWLSCNYWGKIHWCDGWKAVLLIKCFLWEILRWLMKNFNTSNDSKHIELSQINYWFWAELSGSFTIYMLKPFHFTVLITFWLFMCWMQSSDTLKAVDTIGNYSK